MEEMDALRKKNSIVVLLGGELICIS